MKLKFASGARAMALALPALALPALALSATALSATALAQDAAPVTASASGTATEMELAREIIDNGFPPETRAGMFDAVIEQLLAQMRSSMPGLGEDPQMATVFDRHIARVRDTSRDVLSRHIEPIMEGMIVAYADQFTLTELRGLHGFIMTPEGHGFLARTAEINGHPAFAEANEAYMQEYLAQMPQLMERLRADIEKIHGN